MPLKIHAYTAVNNSTGAYVALASSVKNRRIYIQPLADIRLANNDLGTNYIRLAGGALARYDLGVTDPSTLYAVANSASTATNVSVYSIDPGES
jgi:hypothetical protein